MGRKTGLFAGSLRTSHRAAAVRSLIQSDKLNGHDPYAYLKDALQRLPTNKNHLTAELLPHRWPPLHAWHLFGHLVDHVTVCLLHVHMQGDGFPGRSHKSEMTHEESSPEFIPPSSG